MSQIKTKMMQDLKESMKSGDTFRRDTLRMLNASFKQVEVDERIELDDARVAQILKTALKQREDALQSYLQAQREDLIQKERGEIDIILAYLPRQLSDEELEKKVQELIQQTCAEGLKDIGKVMSASKALSDVASGKRISEMAKKLLK